VAGVGAGRVAGVGAAWLGGWCWGRTGSPSRGRAADVEDEATRWIGSSGAATAWEMGSQTFGFAARGREWKEKKENGRFTNPSIFVD
jgi:hypothetical protein